ncbi:hypothetical protein [Streptomyces sp. NPDC014006]|uniref:hypothetical protein n=1 Tax=Streptomyces sp. NPDC014006 TaxID=3364870 RepID=UPI0036FF3111
MTRTPYHFWNTFREPRFNGPEELSVLGYWASDIGEYPLNVVEVIDVVRRARSEVPFTPQDWSGNARGATISAHGVEVEHYFVTHLRGEFTLDEALIVLRDLWDHHVLRRPEEAGDAWSQYAGRTGRNPLAGLRDLTVWSPPALVSSRRAR